MYKSKFKQHAFRGVWKSRPEFFLTLFQSSKRINVKKKKRQRLTFSFLCLRGKFFLNFYFFPARILISFLKSVAFFHNNYQKFHFGSKFIPCFLPQLMLNAEKNIYLIFHVVPLPITCSRKEIRGWKLITFFHSLFPSSSMRLVKELQERWENKE